MAGGRSDKGKKKPLEAKKSKVGKGRADEKMSTAAEAPERTIGGAEDQLDALPLTADPQKRHEQQHVQEKSSADVSTSDNILDQTSPSADGYVEHDSATHRKIEERAFTLFQESGRQHGNDWLHWFEAERQIKEGAE